MSSETMKATNFLGIPHAQVNAYIQKLNFYQIRAMRGHNITIPELPAFLLNKSHRSQAFQGPSTSRNDRFRERAPDRWNGHKHVPTRASKATIETIDSCYSAGNEPVRDSGAERRINVDGGQRAAMYARTYASCIMASEVGNTIQKSHRGDPNSVKTYGWRMVLSEQVLNPIVGVEFTERKWMLERQRGGARVETQIIYVAVPDIGSDLKLLEKVRKCFNEVRSEFHAHRALGWSTWRCDNRARRVGTDAALAALEGVEDKVNEHHDARNCTCKNKTKRLLVCAVLPQEVGTTKVVVLPLRFETFAWMPETLEELLAYADFARKVVEKEG